MHWGISTSSGAGFIDRPTTSCTMLGESFHIRTTDTSHTTRTVLTTQLIQGEFYIPLRASGDTRVNQTAISLDRLPINTCPEVGIAVRLTTKSYKIPDTSSLPHWLRMLFDDLLIGWLMRVARDELGSSFGSTLHSIPDSATRHDRLRWSSVSVCFHRSLNYQ